MIKGKHMANKECKGQLSFAPNGNISPCPFKELCRNYPSGCSGASLWCDRDYRYFEKYGRTVQNMANLDNYECEGQISLSDYQENKFPVTVRGLMDDPFCPRCDCNVFDDIETGICHYCRLRLDFTPWRIRAKE